MSYIQELQEVIRKLHGVESEHVESVPVKETFKGDTVWEGVVEVFRLIEHPTNERIYAWAHDGKDPKKSSVTILHGGRITSAIEAVRVALIQDYRSTLASEEN